MKEMWQAVKINSEDVKVNNLNKNYPLEFAIITQAADDTPRHESFDGKGKYIDGAYVNPQEPLEGDVIAFRPHTYVERPVKGQKTCFISKTFIEAHFTPTLPQMPDDLTLKCLPDYIQGKFTRKGNIYNIECLPVIS
jgi:hypothetical protein